jgi:hypothetical protein
MLHDPVWISESTDPWTHGEERGQFGSVGLGIADSFSFNNFRVLQVLLDRSADPNSRLPRNGSTS